MTNQQTKIFINKLFHTIVLLLLVDNFLVTIILVDK